MIRRVYIIVLVIMSFFMTCSNPCFAQTIKCVERPSQNYVGFGDDLKYYQINYDPTICVESVHSVSKRQAPLRSLGGILDS